MSERRYLGASNSLKLILIVGERITRHISNVFHTFFKMVLRVKFFSMLLHKICNKFAYHIYHNIVDPIRLTDGGHAML